MLAVKMISIFICSHNIVYEHVYLYFEQYLIQIRKKICDSHCLILRRKHRMKDNKNLVNLGYRQKGCLKHVKHTFCQYSGLTIL